MNAEHTSFSEGKSSSNKKLYLFLNLHANEIDKCQEFIRLAASTRVNNQITLKDHALGRKMNQNINWVK
jgi:hypothetical protein